MALIVGIDPGQRCGWAVLEDEQRLESGVWNVQPRKVRGQHLHRGHWYAKLITEFRGLLLKLGGTRRLPDYIAVEKVMGHTGVYAAHEYGALRALLYVVAYEFEVPVTEVPVSTVKRFATGSGSASKEAMVAAASKRWSFKPSRDDEADAIWIAATLQGMLRPCSNESAC